MINKILFVIGSVFAISVAGSSQTVNISGRLVNCQNGHPISYANIVVHELQQGTVSDENGHFNFKLPHGATYRVLVSCLGFSALDTIMKVETDVIAQLCLKPHNLSIAEVVVAAEQKNEQSTMYKIGSTALEHEQILDISQIQSFLPGGKTSPATGLTSTQRLYIRSGSASEKGNPSFGTALQVDGVRLQNNAGFNSSDPYGVDTRNISTVNIESIVVVTGIASVEHGDLSNGMVKINTKKGRTPIIAVVTINPKTKQFGLSKGFALGNNYGTLNVSGEHTKSVSDIMSPYSSYDRNALSLTHEKYFKNKLTLTSGVTFNMGGYNSESDPDMFTGTYSKTTDNVARGYVTTKWSPNNKWISNLELSTSMNYSNKQSETNTRHSSAASMAAIHATETGYFVATNYDENPNAPVTLLPTGYWYRIEYYDNKLMDFSAKIKADRVDNQEGYTNRMLVGLDYSNSGNLGRGSYYGDMRYAPTWRPFVLSDVPHTNNMAIYLEDKLIKDLDERSHVELVAGLRSDNTYVNQSEYGWVSNISPRTNAKYALKNGKTSFVRTFEVYAGWGKSVKLPSLGVLNPTPSYAHNIAFAPGSTANNVAYDGYYNHTNTMLYNSDLKYQYNNQIEIGFRANIKGTVINVSAYRNKTVNPYIYETVFSPYSYKKTDQTSLENSPIPIGDRRYTIDQTTGIVTVHDAGGNHSSYELAYAVKNEFQSRSRYTNGSPVMRMGVDWMVDFAKIKALATSLRLDGNFYYYKGLEEHIFATTSSLLMANDEPYKYIGYYAGSTSYSNGSISRQANANLTITTHIPKARMVVTLRIESSLYDYSQRLSEYAGSKRGFVLENRGDYFGKDTEIYNRNQYVGIYPLYYSKWDDMDTKIPFAEKFAWAKENDPELYTELAKLVEKTYYKNFFNANRISAYYCANLNVTKEIGDIASVSFFARNFTQNLGRVSSTQTGGDASLYSSYIPDFYYGISMRIKL